MQRNILAIPYTSLTKGLLKADNPAIALRRCFRVHDNTEIVVLGIGEDHHLERWWGDFRQQVEVLGAARISAVTPANFSVFNDAPRPQTLINIARGHHFSERLSAQGLPVIPHVYAQTTADWGLWASFLSDQTHIVTLVTEFQTGLKKKKLGEAYIERLSELQNRISRPLHLFAVGGGKYIEKLQQVFGNRYTIIDSIPFMRAINRYGPNMLNPLSPDWVSRPTSEETPIDALLEENLRRHEQRLFQKRDLCRRKSLLLAA